MRGLSVKYFMWGYQPHFQSSAESSAKKLFAQLHPELDASLFLVGIRVREQDDLLPVCIEPDHCSVQPDAFSNFDHEYANALNADERSHMMYSNPVAAKRVDVHLREQSQARAIESCCAKATGQEDRVFFASDPMNVDCYAVSCVLSFDRIAYDSQQVLSGDVIDRVSVERSLIQAVSCEFLDCCRDALRETDAGTNLNVVKASSEELLRRGGHRFLKSIGWREFGFNSLENAYGLCDSMNAISAMYYEGSHSTGRFLLSGRSAGEASDGVMFAVPVLLSDSRRLRKLLEMTRRGFSLLVTDAGVVGMTNIAEYSGFLIDVPGHRHWRVLFSGNVVCEFKYGTPGLPRARISEEEFAELCARVLPSNADIRQLWQLAHSCMTQSHGTTMVVSSRSESEIIRLSRQSTPITPRKLTEAEVAAVSSIDGAILFDHFGISHGIGVILDGMATEEGDPARGARYNSSVRYLTSLGSECLVLIVSEDGDVTLLPKLRDRVTRKSVQDAIEALMQTANETPLRPRVYTEALNVVDQFRFYLSSDECVQLNTVVETAERHLDNNGRTVRILRQKFVPDAEMNSSYFIPDS